MSITSTNSQRENEPVGQREVATKPVKKALTPLSSAGQAPLQSMPIPQQQQQLYATDGSNIVSAIVDKYIPQPPTLAISPQLIPNAIPPSQVERDIMLGMASPALSYGSVSTPPDSADSSRYPASYATSPFPSPFDVPTLAPINMAGMPGSPMAHSPMSLQPPSPMMYSPYGSPYAPYTGISFADSYHGTAKKKSGPVALSRTVYLGNLPADASVDELLSLVRYGPIESVRILPERSCAFISFLDPDTATAFHSDAVLRRLRLHGQELKIGWGKPSTIPEHVLVAHYEAGATRNVFLGNLPENATEQSLRDDLSRFGPIDQVKIVRDKQIAFVHFLSITTAMKVVATLPTEPEWAGRRVYYGKDRTAYVPKNQHQQQQHNLAAAQLGSMAAVYGGYNGLAEGVPNVAAGADPHVEVGNRTVYLGNIHPDTTISEICNAVRGGILQSVRYLHEKHIAFVTFVDAACALAFYQTTQFQGLTLHNRRLKIGFGKNPGPCPPGIAMAVQAGASRNIYVGSIKNFDLMTPEKVREDFGAFGDIEMVNFLKDKQCCFVNFTHIVNAIKALEGMKSHQDYQGLKLSYGKDRCGNPFRGLRPLESGRVPTVKAGRPQSMDDSASSDDKKRSSRRPRKATTASKAANEQIDTIKEQSSDEPTIGLGLEDLTVADDSTTVAAAPAAAQPLPTSAA